ncbi:MAG: assimilatory sulfite reductase (NADPH) flavoprotein subunit [Alphaproteobacteria bacterium]|nr:assimilatory sulfite reductase (NADPH) flavoprotein subunit [Alphaproteobacteria bacterium]MBV9370552.1 assimilatory sulfite reductase (NADPH) flavoprotein subunit [Alphaproteobacteria bacterium]MBV9900080.1 assimilatory sulfite reductase (NADPH) flavoprotein subunit [Alphaproteobacteria bacterium]
MGDLKPPPPRPESVAAAIGRQLSPETALTLEQWQHVEALARSVQPPQAQWISGFFAGLDAGLLRGSGAAAPEPAAAQGRTLTILYGSETGNGRSLAKALASEASARGLSPRLADMADYKRQALKEEEDLLVVASTHGEGDPPQPSLAFFEYLEGPRAPRLERLRFSVLALGDSTYEKYCEAGKRIDRRLEALGATRLHARVDCDVDYDDPAALWSRAVLDRLAADLAAPAPARGGPAAFATATAHDRRNPFSAAVLENIVIVGRGSTKETRHLELDLSGSGLSYEPGDAIGIAAANDPAVAATLIEACGLDGGAPVSVKGEALTLAEALAQRFEIALASPRFVEQWARLSGAAELAALLGEDRAAERVRFLHAHHVVDIVRRYPVRGIDAEGLLAGLRPLQPRLYSIASSLAAMPDEAHITVAPVRYALHGEPRCGVASGQLADRTQMGDRLPVYIQPNPHFRLPAGDAPIVMIGAGTGVAPYRAFLQEREAKGQASRAWLFLGERNFRSDFLYQTEWQAWLKDGVLSRMDVAFSRDQAERIYVQQRMVERGKELFAWLEEGAHLYVCGDAAALAPDVHAALIRIVGEQGGLDREAAEAYVANLAAGQRYQRDVY